MFCIWPIAVAVWFYKTDKVKLEKKWKMAIIVVFFVFILAAGENAEDVETVNARMIADSAVQREVFSEDIGIIEGEVPIHN